MALDRIDHALLIAMEQNSRISLKNLAKELNVKTSTIYHRLHKLKESNILDSFTIVLNPDELGLVNNYNLKIKVKKMVSGPLDSMFLESLSKYLSENYNEILFSSIGQDGFVHCIGTFRSDAHFNSFIEEIKKNPYVDSVESVKFVKILKGKKLFSYISSPLDKEEIKERFAEDEDGDNDDKDKDSDDSEETFEIEL
jgi:DNA-binding Lrp family transcriptional regulator